jgi:hypothetical protein
VASQHDKPLGQEATQAPAKEALEAAFYRALQRYDFKTAVRLMARLAGRNQ